MTLRQYALGVVISSTCIIGGVLWYDRANPDIRAEDIAACIGAGAERKWVTDWLPSTNIVTSTIKSSDILKACSLLRDAITNANVIYLDAGTWSDDGLDMSFASIYNSQAWGLRTNSYTRSSTTYYWMEVYKKLPSDSSFVNGVALRDTAMPVVTVTNISVVTPVIRVRVITTNLVITSMSTNTASPNWDDTGRPVGTVFYHDTESSIYTNASDAANGWAPIQLDQWDYGWWSTTYGTESPMYWGTSDGSLVGTYSNLWGGYPGAVEIGYQIDESFYDIPAVTATNVFVYGGTNMPLYSALGQGPADIAGFKGLIEDKNSWWKYAGFGDVPYKLLDAETISGRGRYTIETKNLDQIRALATNMFRTVQFNFPVTGSNYVFSGGTGTNIYYSVESIDPMDGYETVADRIYGTVSTNAITSINGLMAQEDTQIQTYDVYTFTVPPPTREAPWVRAQCLFTNSYKVFTPSSIPLAAYTNSYVKRLRIYAATETVSPYSYHARTNWVESSTIPHIYEPQVYGENKAQTYGWDVTHGAAIEDTLPTQLQVTPTESLYYSVGYVTTNYVWSLVYDAEYPTNAPTITFGATNFIESSYFSTAPPLAYTADFTGTTGGLSTDYTKNYERNCQTRIAVSALVVDWGFKIFTDTTYYPETYTPPWVTNSP